MKSSRRHEPLWYKGPTQYVLIGFGIAAGALILWLMIGIDAASKNIPPPSNDRTAQDKRQADPNP